MKIAAPERVKRGNVNFGLVGTFKKKSVAQAKAKVMRKKGDKGGIIYHKASARWCIYKRSG